MLELLCLDLPGEKRLANQESLLVVLSWFAAGRDVVDEAITSGGADDGAPLRDATKGLTRGLWCWPGGAVAQCWAADKKLLAGMNNLNTQSVVPLVTLGMLRLVGVFSSLIELPLSLELSEFWEKNMNVRGRRVILTLYRRQIFGKLPFKMTHRVLAPNMYLREHFLLHVSVFLCSNEIINNSLHS